MPKVETIEKGEASDEVKAIFDEIEAAFGMVPNLFKTSAHFPPLLKANWEKVKGVMMQGALSRKAKEAIAVIVSNDNSCDYCVAAHTAALKMLNVTEEEIIFILNEEFDAAEISKKEAALIRLAREANINPNAIPGSIFNDLKIEGASSGEIVEALGVMEIFTGFNKFLDALEVSIDF
ncbi:MAG: peroxidase-related enzyme [Deltaproteobacteria bacterium]|nr:peroxidase-related enzyme [Deltaproteobacteria bacterium]